MADLAGIHQLLEGGHRVADGNTVLPVPVLVAQPAKVVGGALRPVELVQVDDFGLQALQAPFHGTLQALRTETGAAADMLHIVARAGGLGGQDHLVPMAGAGKPVADDGFGAE